MRAPDQRRETSEVFGSGQWLVLCVCMKVSHCIHEEPSMTQYRFLYGSFDGSYRCCVSSGCDCGVGLALFWGAIEGCQYALSHAVFASRASGSWCAWQY